MACCLQQLSQHGFPRIGSLVESGSDGSAARRVTTQNMIQLANIPRPVFPLGDKRYKTVDEKYVTVSGIHMTQVILQDNDLVLIENDDDC